MKKHLTLAGLLAGFTSLPAWAQSVDPQGLEIIGVPTDGNMGFQPGVTELATDMQWLDGMILVIITIISLFVTALLVWVALRYNAKRNPSPATFTHHTPVEIAWTVVPILILVAIGAWSLPILFRQQEIPVADVTIKAIGNQWYWSYEYVDDEFAFDSYMIGAPALGGENMKTPEVVAELEAAGYTEAEWLLATDTAVVVPVNKTVVVQVTASDVIHSWTIPAFGVKQDGVPGRLAELWFSAEKEGVYFGQCSELCGQAHAYMPITVKVVSEEEYAQWLSRAKEEYAGIPQTLTVASAD
ncbi:cytochrome c oxidase subunit II [Sulfitobacter donghicola]|uniref:Cytochrome c oxidase subunit 2 n=1 Tax=Sulfitobacter donghicola DSW-25 = KCTC 12864 = JCM 14565 TaxID=1300350 RepID=A0A073IFI6_9RHOB|nr:cytochrome c oxidase subunit II [Sulfitobacter donghicola]KEJ88266.1 cytochrome C oxidase subunit II [Sulfitobacter donghicola DSW-25 = KCTC 12864 = JCM 14565]KIN68860.1 cytochrome c oxidase subunit 2 [Sulfitobacter donghicola DSW-25 = KCTC 12864 = JCM 14565]